MADLKKSAITLLSSTSSVDMKTAQKNDLYTVPPAKKAIITHIVIRTTSASLAGGADYDFGTGANADTWKQTVDLSGLTAGGTDFYIISGDGAPYTIEDAGDVFGVKIITGASSAATATIDVFGYEYDA